MNISTKEASNLIKNSSGKIFTVVFTKKDGSDRTMTARTEVSKHTVGGVNHVAEAHSNLLPVFDMSLARDAETAGKKAYRMINLDTIKVLKFNGVEYIVTLTGE